MSNSSRRILLISDVHGNLPALEAALEFGKNQKVTETWCLGDTYGYGKQGDACFEKLMGAAQIILMGNHDLFAAQGRVLIEGTAPPNKDNQEHLSYLKAWERVTLGDWPLYLCHASTVDTLWEFISSRDDARLAWQMAPKDIEMMLVGHTHKAAAYWKEPDGREFWVDESMTQLKLPIKKGGKYILNPGSVGAGPGRYSVAILECDSFGNPSEIRWHMVKVDN